MGTFSKSLASCGGFIAGPAEVIEYLRISSRPFIFTASAVPAAVGAALGALRVIRAEGPELMARLLDNAAYLRQGYRDLGLQVVEPGTLPDGTEANTPVVPVVVGEDWQAVLLWKALFDAGVYTNVAIHPAVPPGGALLRTSLMATHEREHLDRALEIFERVLHDFPDVPRSLIRISARSVSPWVGSFGLSDPEQGPVVKKKCALSERPVAAERRPWLTARARLDLGCLARRTHPGRGAEGTERVLYPRPPPTAASLSRKEVRRRKQAANLKPLQRRSENGSCLNGRPCNADAATHARPGRGQPSSPGARSTEARHCRREDRGGRGRAWVPLGGRDDDGGRVASQSAPVGTSPRPQVPVRARPEREPRSWAS